MMSAGRRFVFGAASLIAVGALVQGQTPAASYTTSQAQEGEVAYQDVCATCHMSNLAGAFEAPELAGPSFLGMWGGRPVNDLFEYVKVAMPPAGRKPTDDSLTSIVAYILQENGMDAGGTPLTATTEDAIARLPP